MPANVKSFRHTMASFGHVITVILNTAHPPPSALQSVEDWFRSCFASTRGPPLATETGAAEYVVDAEVWLEVWVLMLEELAPGAFRCHSLEALMV